MKKAFPVLWRYILVVIMSTALAFFISQNTARAAESPVANNENANIYGCHEPFMVQTASLTWGYDSRNNDILVLSNSPVRRAVSLR